MTQIHCMFVTVKNLKNIKKQPITSTTETNKQLVIVVPYVVCELLLNLNYCFNVVKYSLGLLVFIFIIRTELD